MNTILLQDADGVIWAVTLTDAGVINPPTVSSGVPALLLLNDASGKSYNVTVSTLGVLAPQRVAQANYRQLIPIQSTPSGFVWQLFINPSGQLKTSNAQPPAPSPSLVNIAPSVPASAKFAYLRLDADNDPVFQVEASLTDLEAVRQCIKTRLLLFEGEWWENLQEGTPMFQEIIGARATPNQQQIMALALAQRISQTPFVSGVSDMAFSFEPIARRFSYSAKADTSFGTVTINFTPGVSASVS